GVDLALLQGLEVDLSRADTGLGRRVDPLRLERTGVDVRQQDRFGEVGGAHDDVPLGRALLAARLAGERVAAGPACGEPERSGSGEGQRGTTCPVGTTGDGAAVHGVSPTGVRSSVVVVR